MRYKWEEKVKEADNAFSGMQSIARAVAVLDSLGSRVDEGCKLADVVRDTGLGRATTYRFLKGLEYLGLVELEERSGRYFLGARLAALGAAASNRFGLTRCCRPHLRRLAERSEDTVYLTVRIGTEAICAAREEGSFPIKTLTLNVGDRRPLGVGAGSLALLSFLDSAQIDHSVAFSAPGAAAFGFDVQALWDAVNESRRLGYALNRGRIVPGMLAVGLPILASDGFPVAALSIAAITSRLESPRREMLVTWIREEIDAIEAVYGPLFSSAAPDTSAGLMIAGAEH